MDAGFTGKVIKTVDEKTTEREKNRKAAALEAEAVDVVDDNIGNVADAAMGVEDDAEDAATSRPALGLSYWRSA